MLSSTENRVLQVSPGGATVTCHGKQHPRGKVQTELLVAREKQSGRISTVGTEVQVSNRSRALVCLRGHTHWKRNEEKSSNG